MRCRSHLPREQREQSYSDRGAICLPSHRRIQPLLLSWVPVCLQRRNQHHPCPWQVHQDPWQVHQDRYSSCQLRKASVTDRPTQTQIPIRLVQTFFAGVSSVESAHSGVIHGLHQASARGSVNTIKLEIPEMRQFVDPVARFEKTGSGVTYEVHNASSPSGKQIVSRLQAGHVDGSTQTSIKDHTKATWWRFI